jgi:hypothetical protein
MSETRWKSLYEDLDILDNPRLVPISKPTPKDILSFESTTGLLLPASYKEFILVFGPGTLAKEFQILSPKCKASSYDLLTVNQERFSQVPDPEEAVWSPFPTDELLQRFVTFCTTALGNHRFGWDPETITDSTLMEYAVYFHPRLERQAKKVADSFGDFIENLCLGDDFFRIYRRKGYWDASFPRRAFVPVFSSRYKKKSEPDRPSRTTRPAIKRTPDLNAPPSSPKKRKRKRS